MAPNLRLVVDATEAYPHEFPVHRWSIVRSGVELILDAIGGDSLRKGYRLLARTGRLGMFGISSAVTQKERRVLDMLGVLARTPWFQFNPMSLISANKGVFGVNLGHLWGEIDRIRGWGEQYFLYFRSGRLKTMIASSGLALGPLTLCFRPSIVPKWFTRDLWSTWEPIIS
jgi:NADPH:quinone reductase-like Zn-dependent oxidoreductase